MTTTEAAKLIGISSGRVRQLCRAGDENPQLIKLGKAIKSRWVPHGTVQRRDITEQEVHRFRNLTPLVKTGYPRGRPQVEREARKRQKQSMGEST